MLDSFAHRFAAMVEFLRRELRRTTMAYLIVALGLILTAVATASVARQTVDNARAAHAREAADVESAIAERMAHYIAALQGARGLFAASDAVMRDDWAQYVRALDLQARYPGVRSVAYARWVLAAERDDFLAAMRTDGIPEYAIPGGDGHEAYVPLTYVEPLSAEARRALGFDALADPIRRVALERARDTGMPAATESTILATESGAAERRSVLLYIPVYQGGEVPGTLEERRAALDGFVLTGWRMDELMGGVLGPGASRPLAFAIVDGPVPGRDHLLYASDGLESAATAAALARPVRIGTLEVAGRTWTIAFAERAGGAASDGWALPAFVASAGVLTSFLLGALMRTLVLGRGRAERRYRDLFAHTGDIVFAYALDGRCLELNPAAARLLGYPEAELRALPLDKVIVPAQRDAVRQLMRALAARGTEGAARSREVELLAHDGSPVSVEIGARLARSEDGTLIVQGIGRDIAERKRAQAALAASEARLRLHYEHCPLPTLTWRWAGDDFVLIDRNAAQDAMAGGRMDAHIGQPMREIHRDRPDLIADHARCLAERATFRREFAYRIQSTGETRQLAVTYVFVPPDLVVAYAEDLTVRQANEAALRAGERQARALQVAAERRAWELQLLDRVRTALVRELDPVAVCRVVVEEIAAAFGYTQVSLYRRDGNEHVLQHQVGYDRVLARVPVDAGISGRAVRAGRPLLIEDVAADPDFLGAIAGLSSEICVPLVDDGRPAGFLNVESTGGMRLDADDLRLLTSLGEQVGIALERAHLHAALREREGLLAHQATHDALTELPNRALFLDRLERALARARRDASAVSAVLFLDLDRFKTINDSLGHAAGDALLVAAAARLSGCLREADTLARFGGDEFALLLEDCGDLAGALRVANRLLVALSEPLPVAGRALTVTVSIGLALSSGAEDAPADLLRFADVALYRAKEAGRACCEVFYPGMNGADLARLELEHDLRAALERDEFVLHYQPKVDLSSGRIAVVEALVRWHHPTRGLIPPGEFIPLAEETGLIVPLGRWALAEACRQLQAWRGEFAASGTPAVAVNLSARQFRHPDLVAEVALCLAASGLPANRLVLEITESAAMERVEEAAASLATLKALGVRLALDDFGAGYSSLGHLELLPFDTLKIDRRFFADTAQNRVIVRSVTALAHGLGLDVTAEGLESSAQVAWARAVGCDRGQGFYFAPPLPATELGPLLESELAFSLPGDADHVEQRSVSDREITHTTR